MPPRVVPAFAGLGTLIARGCRDDPVAETVPTRMCGGTAVPKYGRSAAGKNIGRIS
jgi:hypothetical protein